jgi:hypothetical protein
VNLHRFAQVSPILYKIKSGVNARWIIETGDRPIKRILSGLGVLRLPPRPEEVDHAVMQPECRVGGRHEDVAHVLAHCPVASAVWCEGGGSWDRVREVVLKGCDVGFGEESIDNLLVGVVVCHWTIQIAAQAVWCVVQRAGRIFCAEHVGGSEVAEVDGCAGFVRFALRERTEREDTLFERPTLNTSTTITGRKGNIPEPGYISTRIERAIASQTRLRAIEERTVDEILGPPGPVPVRQCTLKPTLVFERFLEKIQKVSMP